MRIDARYFIPVAFFYVPGILAAGGAFILGYSLAEARSFVAIFGAVAGTILAMVSAAIMVDRDAPIWIKLWGRS